MNFVEEYKAALEGKTIVNPDFPSIKIDKCDTIPMVHVRNSGDTMAVSEYIHENLGILEEVLFFKSDNFQIKNEKVKKSRWINIYPNEQFLYHYTKEAADSTACDDRITCVEIEWEE